MGELEALRVGNKRIVFKLLKDYNVALHLVINAAGAPAVYLM